ncbi:MAG: Hpt domain-containing protein [Bacteroidetes bacterium]|jgi:HPt (histidine-containing phosphotransfer) domain-containing protein|nr:Hpt domain-containing protein [Bacteroidota bacterium]
MENNYKLYRIREMASGDETFVLALIDAFLEEIPSDLNHLKEAVLNSDFRNIKYYAHKMKPTLDLFETGLVGHAVTLESTTEDGTKNVDIQETFSELNARINQILQELRTDFNR